MDNNKIEMAKNLSWEAGRQGDILMMDLTG